MRGALLFLIAGLFVRQARADCMDSCMFLCSGPVQTAVVELTHAPDGWVVRRVSGGGPHAVGDAVRLDGLANASPNGTQRLAAFAADGASMGAFGRVTGDAFVCGKAAMSVAAAFAASTSTSCFDQLQAAGYEPPPCDDCGCASASVGLAAVLGFALRRRRSY